MDGCKSRTRAFGLKPLELQPNSHTIATDTYLSIISLLKKLILSAGKVPYVLAMGKPSPAKLGNFLDLDAFVLVACAENSLLDSREFHVPVVTPHELLLALGKGQEWSHKCDLSLGSVSALIQESLNESAPSGEEEEEPYFSLVTGTYKMRLNRSQGQEVCARSDGQIALLQGSGAVAYLQERRSYKGLVQALGETCISDVVQGRDGAASGYSSEPLSRTTP